MFFLALKLLQMYDWVEISATSKKREYVLACRIAQKA